MAELMLGAVDIRESGTATSGSGIFFDIVSGYFEPPEVRGVDTLAPGLDGRIVRNRVHDRRIVTLEGYILGTTPADFASNWASFAAVIDPAVVSNLVVDDGYLGSGGATLPVRFLNGNFPIPMEGPTKHFMSIELESVAPDWA